jgi:hypothetical protein
MSSVNRGSIDHDDISLVADPKYKGMITVTASGMNRTNSLLQSKVHSLHFWECLRQSHPFR